MRASSVTVRACVAALSIGAFALTGAPAQAADSCSNAAYRTGAGARLPDCRAYEQVSPVEKGGVPVAANYPVVTSPDGNRNVFLTPSALPGDEASFLLNAYSAGRGASWSTANINPPQSEVAPATTGGVAQAVSEDLTRALVISRRALSSDAVEGNGNVYVRDLRARDRYRLVASGTGAGLLSLYGSNLSYPARLFYAGTSDFSNIAFSTRDVLTASAPQDDTTKLYRRDSGGALRYLATAGTNDIAPTGPDVHRFSDDGRRLTYANLTSAAQNVTDLYQDTGSGAPRLLSRSHRTNENQQTPRGITGRFLNSSDGTSVTFAAYTPLVNGQVPVNAGGGVSVYQTIYRWSADDSLVDLLAGRLQTDDAKQRGQQLLFASDDGAYVYFTSTGALAPGADPSEYNLYVLHNGQLSLISNTTIAGAETLRASADGSRIAFATTTQLGAYDNSNPSCTSDNSGRCREVWTYDADTPDVAPTCVSCPASGAAPTSDATLGASGGGFSDARARAIFNDGRVYFDSGERLAAGDGNATTDVYEASPGSPPRLLSGGGGGGPSTLGDVSEDASSVSFVTGAGLVPQDTDGLRDLYVARTGGGLAAQQTAPTAVQPCAGSECQGAPPAARQRPVPGSSSLVPFLLPRAATFKVSRPSSAAVRDLGRRGRLTLSVKVGGPGRVTLRARARVGRSTKTVGTASATARRAGTVKLGLRLSKAARRELSRRRRLGIVATVAFSQAPKSSTLRFTVTAPRKRSSSAGGGR